MIGTAMAHADGAFHPASAVAALLAAVFIQIGTNFCNDYCDFRKGADKERIGPVRATQAGLVSPQAMLFATFLAFSGAVFAAMYLFVRGGWPVAAIGAASILSGILYTAGPKPLAYVGLGDVFVLVFFGPVAVAGTYYVQALNCTPASIVAGLSPGLLAVGILVVNNLRDLAGDAKACKRTLAVRFGARFTRIQYSLCVVAGCALSPAVLVLAQGARLSVLAGMCALCSAYPPLRRVWRHEGAALNPALGQTAKVLLLYAVMFSIGCLLG